VKKVLVYKSDLLPYSETFIREQILACRRWRPVLVGTHVVSGVSLEGLDIRLLGPSSTGPLGRKWREVLRELDYAPPRTVAKLKREAASLVHVHFGHEAVAFWPIARRLGLPIAVTLHGTDINIHREWWERRGAGFATRRYPTRLLKLTRQPRVHFIAVSNAVLDRAIDYGIPAEQLSVRYVGVDVTRFVSAGNPIIRRKRRIIFVGRTIENKGGDVLIEAFARVRAEVGDAELVIVGDGPLLEAWKRLAARAQVPVVFTGALPSAGVKRQLDEARVFCLPSYTTPNGAAEGLPIVILEAQACGLPVVTSARGGTTEGIRHGETGFAFPERDVSALATALTRLLRDDELAQSMAEAGPRFVAERFDIRRCTSDLENLYDELVGAGHPARGSTPFLRP
jgi:glycosyltransferase involved in cell wall biosynthesis